MQNRPREVLRRLVARHGLTLCDDTRRCEAFLKDLCGQHRLEISLLVSAQREQVPQQLSRSAASAPESLLVLRLAQQLEEGLGLASDKARWAVESWAWILQQQELSPGPDPDHPTALRAANYQAGVKAYERGDFAAALEQFRPLARQGHAEAQAYLGLMYLDGRGLPKRYKDAVKWCRLAAEQGHAGGQNTVGWMYQHGRGVPQSDKDAVKWYRLAAKQGHADGQTNLGHMYRHGDGVPQSDKDAVKWYRLAAKQGHADAQFALGVMYDEGRGVLQDDEEAAKWLRLAAEQGHSRAKHRQRSKHQDSRGMQKSGVEIVGSLSAKRELVESYQLAAKRGDAAAQVALGHMYKFGDGVPQSPETAVKWYRLAAEQGHADAQFYLGHRYEVGRGVPQSDAEAAMWYRLAAEQGQADALYHLDRMYRSGRAAPQNGRTR